ncbi:hypothetical protein [Streptomyces himalayensis]|uniref:Uncharacterized protein n=1 Tax=Streptomyces himalayensis subsp. himalayensis TaxID=2756131 RepID=A0A7W0DID0_9ACTN|nr:hypothetical protein [Streptomyces himalayensis]MBA2945193.1 hypothetical protein [Streptomyces himalayensis subsp. himalayensis]
MLKKRVMNLTQRVINHGIQAKIDELRFTVGAMESRLATLLPHPERLQDTEYKVFSQGGEDGILEFLTSRLSPPDVFIEIGVGDYTESNTRFLAMKDNWRGAIIDSGTAHIDFLRCNGMAWRWSISPVSAFVTAENINELIHGAGIEGEIGVLSIDIDGVDYWVWKAISTVSPWVVVIEYNSVFGPDNAVTVPYDPEFVSSEAHHSLQFYGASLSALHHLGVARGYRLVGVGSNGVNAFFVRNDVAGHLWDLSPSQAFVRSRVRTARGADGKLTYTGDDHGQVLHSMRDKLLHVVDMRSNLPIAEVFGI